MKFTFSGEAVCCTVELQVAVHGWVKVQCVGDAHTLYLIYSSSGSFDLHVRHTWRYDTIIIIFSEATRSSLSVCKFPRVAYM